jgi:small subunit ribosomal protein S16
MLAIRMQRTGRKGHAMFRVIVQDSRRTPTSGKVVAYLGSYDPHAKTVSFDKEKAAFYLDHGAQPSDRVVRLLKSEGVKLPAWVTPSAAGKREVRNPDKRRSTRPPEAAKPVDETPAPEAPEAKTEEATETADAEAEAAEASEKPEETADAAVETPAETAPEAEDSPAETDETAKTA